MSTLFRSPLCLTQLYYSRATGKHWSQEPTQRYRWCLRPRKCRSQLPYQFEKRATTRGKARLLSRAVGGPRRDRLARNTELAPAQRKLRSPHVLARYDTLRAETVCKSMYLPVVVLRE